MLESRATRRRVAAVAAASLTAALVPIIGSAATATAAPTELFISEYIEGTSNNKALEIFNGTGSAVDLATGGYNVQMFFNGAVSAGLTINLTGTVATGDVFVLANASASAPILAQADQTNGAGWYNGDDAVVLRKGTTVLDVVGQIGFDPGTEWGTGLTSTADNTLRRLASVEAGDANGADAFDPASEWEGFATDTFGALGAHPGSDVAPRVTTSVPASGASGVSVTENLSVSFSEPVSAGPAAFALTCGGAVALAVSGGPATYTLDPAAALPSGATCTLTVTASAVSDADTIDPPDTLAANYTATFTTLAGNPCTVPATPIPDIQGSGAAAAITGVVTTRGVVVGDYEGPSPALRGFYLQDPTGDGNLATSDGIFVFGGNLNRVQLGQLVTVTGTAGEFQDQTQISAGSVTVCDEGPVPVPPAEVAFPLGSAADLERVEGMLVSIPQEMTVTEHFQLGRFGQVVVSSGGRLQQPTNVAEPGTPALDLQASNNLRRIIIDDELQNQNPDPIHFGRDGAPLSASNTLRGGDTVTGAVGVMTYTWAGNAASGNAYRLRPRGALGGQAAFGAGNPRPAAAPEVGGSLQVAGMNVLNYFNTFSGCTNGVGGEPDDCRGAETPLEFERQATKTVEAITKMGTEVVGLVEIENDGYGPDSALADLVGRLNAVQGPGTWAYVDVDAATHQVNALGTDAIKVGLIYQPAKVTPVGETAVLNTADFVVYEYDPTLKRDVARNRPALAQAFRENATGGVFVPVVNHLKSKGSACDVPDAGDGQGNCNAVRTQAAGKLASWLAADPTATGDEDVLVLGDLNSYAMEDPIDVLVGAGYTNLVSGRLGPDAYSYVFDGQWGYLDHALGSATLAGQVAGVGDWHVNADEPSVLDYNTNFKSPGQITSLYAPDEFRNSDHDPVVVGLDLTSDSAGFVTGGGWIASPVGGKGSFELDVRYDAGAARPEGTVTFSLSKQAFALEGTALDWLILADGTARIGGSATVNGTAGYRFDVTTVDGGRQSDTFHIVVRNAEDEIVYDSTPKAVQGQVTVHPTA
jgi:predicted extracellular nuclease